MEQTVPRFGYWGNVVVGFVIVLAVSLGLYWLFVDPEWGVISKTYPQPWFVWFFWAIMVLCWFSFEGSNWPFNKLKQPWCGILSTLAICVVAAGVNWFICGVLGRVDPTFAWDGVGKDAASFVVLIGFVLWNTWPVNWQHYPWTDLGLKQPIVGLVEVAWGAVWVTFAYIILFWPHFAAWAGVPVVGEPLMSFPTTIGWFYACLILFLFNGVIFENWPYSIFKKRWQMGVASFVGIWGLGTLLFLVTKWALGTFMLTEAVRADIGADLPMYVAQYFVWWALWVIFWANINPGKTWPYKYSPAVNRLGRLAVFIVIPTALFYIYYYWFAGAVLHEPAVGSGVGGFSGNALGFADWFILINLFWCASFANWGLTKTVKAS